jgi:hypothetical protein
MDLLQYPRVAHVVDYTNCHAQDTIGLTSNTQPTEPLGDNDIDLPACPPPAAQLVELCGSRGRCIDDVEIGSPRNELTPDHTSISYLQRIQRLLSTLSVAKAIPTRTSQLLRLPTVVQAMQTRIGRLRKLPHVVQAIQGHVEQDSSIPHVLRAMQASIERLLAIPPLIQAMRRSLNVPASNPTKSHPALRSNWCCFICIAMSGREIVAMEIPCPPSKSGLADRETKIYQNIKERLTIYYGMSRYLPFYGVQEVQEVNV